MKKKRRTILFFILAAIFIITAPLTVLYSLGWRIDIKTGKINQPGIFYFKVNPKNVQIFLDGKLKKKTDFFFGSLLIENLSAKKYQVAIKKDGFYDWQKTLEIKNGEATEAKNIVLIPKNPSFSALSKNISKLFFSPDSKIAILEEKEEDSWSLKIYETNKNVKSHLLEENDLLIKAGLSSKNATIEISNLIFSNDSRNALLETKINFANQSELKNQKVKTEKTAYYIVGLDKSYFDIIYLNIEEDIKKIAFNPENNTKIFILSIPTDSEKNMGELSQLDIISKEKTLYNLSKEIISFDIFGNSIFFLDSSGNIFETDFYFNKYEKINSAQFSINKDYKYEIFSAPSDIIIKENNSLYCLDKAEKSISKISDQVSSFKFSPDYQKLFYANDYEIFILFLLKEDSQPQKEKDSQMFLTRFSEKIGKIFWYTNYYLAFNAGDKIKIIEIDDRDKLNIVDLIEFKNPEIFWDDFEKKLYVFSENTLFSSDKLVQ